MGITTEKAKAFLKKRENTILSGLFSLLLASIATLLAVLVFGAVPGVGILVFALAWPAMWGSLKGLSYFFDKDRKIFNTKTLTAISVGLGVVSLVALFITLWATTGLVLGAWTWPMIFIPLAFAAFPLIVKGLDMFLDEFVTKNKNTKAMILLAAGFTALAILVFSSLLWVAPAVAAGTAAVPVVGALFAFLAAGGASTFVGLITIVGVFLLAFVAFIGIAMIINRLINRDADKRFAEEAIRTIDAFNDPEPKVEDILEVVNRNGGPKAFQGKGGEALLVDQVRRLEAYKSALAQSDPSAIGLQQLFLTKAEQITALLEDKHLAYIPNNYKDTAGALTVEGKQAVKQYVEDQLLLDYCLGEGTEMGNFAQAHGLLSASGDPDLGFNYITKSFNNHYKDLEKAGKRAQITTSAPQPGAALLGLTAVVSTTQAKNRAVLAAQVLAAETARLQIDTNLQNLQHELIQLPIEMRALLVPYSVYGNQGLSLDAVGIADLTNKKTFAQNEVTRMGGDKTSVEQDIIAEKRDESTTGTELESIKGEIVILSNQRINGGVPVAIYNSISATTHPLEWLVKEKARLNSLLVHAGAVALASMPVAAGASVVMPLSATPLAPVALTLSVAEIQDMINEVNTLENNYTITQTKLTSIKTKISRLETKQITVNGVYNTAVGNLRNAGHALQVANDASRSWHVKSAKLTRIPAEIKAEENKKGSADAQVASSKALLTAHDLSVATPPPYAATLATGSGYRGMRSLPSYTGSFTGPVGGGPAPTGPTPRS